MEMAGGDRDPLSEDAGHTSTGSSATIATDPPIVAEEANPGYHYWHDKVAKGEGAAPITEPKRIAVEMADPANDSHVSIENFALMDDDDVIKVYVKLEGDLASVTEDDVDLKVEKKRYDPDCSMLLTVKGATKTHRLYAEKLKGTVKPEESKLRVLTKKGKIVVSLKKQEPVYWDSLRSPTSLPYRRGGGGRPR